MRHRQTSKEKIAFVWGAYHVLCFTLLISSWKWRNLIFRILFITCILHWVECSSGTALRIFTLKKHCLLAQSVWNLSFLHLQNCTAFSQCSNLSPILIPEHPTFPFAALPLTLQLRQSQLNCSYPILSGTLHMDQLRHPRPALTLHNQNSLSGLAQGGFSLCL